MNFLKIHTKPKNRRSFPHVFRKLSLVPQNPKINKDVTPKTRTERHKKTNVKNRSQRVLFEKKSHSTKKLKG